MQTQLKRLKAFKQKGPNVKTAQLPERDGKYGALSRYMICCGEHVLARHIMC